MRSRPYPQVGYAIGRRCGGAVARNRIRRRLRAAAREVCGELEPGAYLVGAEPGVATLPYAELVGTLAEIMTAAVAAVSHPHRSRGIEMTTGTSMSRSQRTALGLITVYQGLRIGRPSPCRFYPSCSAYAAEAIERHGAWRGSRLAIRRLSRCHPFGGRGVDLVPLPVHPTGHAHATREAR